MSAKAFFTEIALPLYRRFEADRSAMELLWAATIAVHQVPDYVGVEKYPDKRQKQNRKAAKLRKKEPLLTLGIIAEALKHGQKIDDDVPRAAAANARQDILAIQDFLAEPDVLTTRVVDVDGQSESMAGTLKLAVEHWKTTFK